MKSPFDNLYGLCETSEGVELRVYILPEGDGGWGVVLDDGRRRTSRGWFPSETEAQMAADDIVCAE